MAKAPTKNDVIKKYLQGDLERFLKRVYRYSKHELIFSVTLNEYEKEVPGIRKQILRIFRKEYPGNIAQIINVHRVMVKYYDFVIDLEDIALCHRIDHVLFTDIHAYRVKQTNYRVNKLMLNSHSIKAGAALKELKARGFIHVNDFEDFDRNMAHISTNANIPDKGKKLYYPMNFTWDAKSKANVINKGKNWWDFTDVYLIHGVIGVSGFTRVSTPLSR